MMDSGPDCVLDVVPRAVRISRIKMKLKEN